MNNGPRLLVTPFDARTIPSEAGHWAPPVGAPGRWTNGLHGMNVLVGQKEDPRPGKFSFSYSIMFYFLIFYL